jgi:4-aminobutyrate aminotransferase-like enzyme
VLVCTNSSSVSTEQWDNTNGQAHPLSCAAAIAVQKVSAAENLLEKWRQTSEHLADRLRERPQSPDALAYPFVFDVRGGGSFWAVEFDLTGPEGRENGSTIRDGCASSLLREMTDRDCQWEDRGYIIFTCIRHYARGGIGLLRYCR